MKPRARSKMSNRPTVVDGIRFASAKEARRYRELKLLEKVGEIKSLELQPRYKLDVNGVHVCTYVADFRYHAKTGELFVCDVKGRKAGVQYQMFRLKAKLMKAIYGIYVQEV